MGLMGWCGLGQELVKAGGDRAVASHDYFEKPFCSLFATWYAQLD